MMYFHTYALIVTYFMASLGLFSASLVETMETPFIASVGTAVFMSLVFNIVRKKPLPSYLWTIAAVLVLVLFALDYLSAASGLITSASRFLAILLALKLFDVRRERDYIIVYSIVFFQILACAASTVSPLFFLILFLFTAGSIWAMIIYNLRKDLQEGPRTKPAGPTVAFGMPFFITVTATSAVSLILTLMLFLILPRTGAGLFDFKTLNTVKLTGFSERVAPGVLGPLKQNPAVVMRVQVRGDKDAARLRRLRGVSLDRFDGAAWTGSIKESAVVRKGAGGSFAVGRHNGALMELEIMLEPTDSDVIFAPPGAVRLEGKFTNIWLDHSGGLRLPSAPFSRVDYRVWASHSAPPDDSARMRGEYLDASFMGDGPPARRMTALLRDILRGKDGDLERARAIEEHLKTRYSYTLDPRKGEGVNPLDDFLFYSKEGYCEHYASAMAALLRASSIPSRVVTGFLPGEWNGYGRYFIVREQDAHSWVEAYIKGSGWTTFDPTPEAGVAPTRGASALALYMDFLRLRWNRHIIHFSLADQRRLAHGVEDASHRLYTFMRSAVAGGGGAGTAALRATGLAAAAILALILVKSMMRGRPGRSKAPEFYEEMARALRKRGLARMAGETPLEFAIRTGDPLVMEVTAFFHAARYGRRALSGYDLARAGMAVEEIKKGSGPWLLHSKGG